MHQLQHARSSAVLAMINPSDALCIVSKWLDVLRSCGLHWRILSCKRLPRLSKWRKDSHIHRHVLPVPYIQTDYINRPTVLERRVPCRRTTAVIGAVKRQLYFMIITLKDVAYMYVGLGMHGYVAYKVRKLHRPRMSDAHVRPTYVADEAF